MLRANLPRVEGPRLAVEQKPLPDDKLSTLITRGTGDQLTTLLVELGYQPGTPACSPLLVVNSDGRIGSSSIRLFGSFWTCGYKGRQLWSRCDKRTSVEVSEHMNLLEVSVTQSTATSIIN